MMKMDRTPPTFAFFRIVTKCFTMVSYYFSCNSVQVFLMKEKYVGLQRQCTDIRCCILLTEKKPGLH